MGNHSFNREIPFSRILGFTHESVIPPCSSVIGSQYVELVRTLEEFANMSQWGNPEMGWEKHHERVSSFRGGCGVTTQVVRLPGPCQDPGGEMSSAGDATWRAERVTISFSLPSLSPPVSLQSLPLTKSNLKSVNKRTCRRSTKNVF